MTLTLGNRTSHGIDIEYGGRELTISAHLLSVIDEEMARLNKSQPDSVVLIAVANRLERDDVDRSLRLELAAYARCALRMRRADIPDAVLALLDGIQNATFRKLCVEVNRTTTTHSSPSTRW